MRAGVVMLIGAPGWPRYRRASVRWTQIAAEFPSPFMHLGADETWDLGAGRSRDQVGSQGRGPVYVAFLKQIHDELAPLNRRLLFWGDIAQDSPDLLKAMPQRANAANKETHSASTVHFPIARGPCKVSTHNRNMTPSEPDASGTLRLVKKLNAASKKPAITRYDRSRCAGIQFGINVMI